MQYVTDLHLHSKYSRAVSPQMNLSTMADNARQKGLDILTAGDFTHPVWSKEIRQLLVESEEGLYQLEDNTHQGKAVRFMLSTEISSIYKQGDKLRRIHSLIFVPNFETAEKFTQALVNKGCNLNADGRPIIGISVKNLYELLLSIDERSYLIPAHVWTPHFGVYGSASGFDSLEEAFGEFAKYVYAIETGISSDPGMNWQIPELARRAIVSFSDAHSAPKMAREATVVELASLSYLTIKKAFSRLSEGGDDANKIAYTLEFYPEEGKYHFSGHRNCKVMQGPEEIRKNGNTCPVCHRRLTEGVLYRVQELSDETLSQRVIEKKDAKGVNWFTDKEGVQAPYVKLVPLLEIAAESLDSTVNSQKSKNLYMKLCNELVSELHVLLRASLEEIEKVGGARVAQAVAKVRAGEIAIDPGYDGEYGKVQIWQNGEEKASNVPQLKFDL